jgi:hypothetical protein
MFAVINHLHLTRSVDEIGLSMKQEGLAILAAQPGFIDFKLVRVDDSHGVVIILWASGADAQAGSAVFGPTWFAKNVAPFLASEQERSVGPVVVSYRE